MLILEDDAFLAKHLRRLFTSRGFEVHATASVADFLSVTPRIAFDVLLLDFSLPDGTGLSAWAVARGTQERAVAVLMTAYGTDTLETEARDLGIVAVLPKPLDLPRLLETTGAHDRSAWPAAPHPAHDVAQEARAHTGGTRE